jgi:hypothetical protein
MQYDVGQRPAPRMSQSLVPDSTQSNGRGALHALCKLAAHPGGRRNWSEGPKTLQTRRDLSCRRNGV